MRFIVLLLTINFLLLSIVPITYAANGTIKVVPDSGTRTVGTPFSIDIVVDGQTDAFNAAQATVSVSPAFTVNNVLLGNCNFSFVTTPTISNPSFVGVILGASSNNCTAYTLNLTPASLGEGTITISNASIKKNGTAEELLQSVQSATYTINASSNNQQNTVQTTVESETPASNPGLVTVSLKVVDDNNNPVENVSVSLDSAPGGSQTTNKEGIANFTNISAGVHSVSVDDKGKNVAEKIINVSGHEPVLALGVKTQDKQLNWYQFVLPAVVFVLAIVAVFIYRQNFKNLLLQFFKKNNA